MLSTKVIVTKPEGLHARVAHQLVEAVLASNHVVWITNPQGIRANGRSILSVLSLAVKAGEGILIEVEGENGQPVLDLLTAVVSA